MELQVVAKKENPLLKRVEITFKAIHKAEPTPTRDAIRTELAKQLKAGKESVVVDRSVSSFGRFETVGYAKVYKSKEEALAVERSHILIRNKLKEPVVKKKEGEKAEKPAKAEAKPETPKAEPKAEHKPEAPKAEHKAEAKPEHKEEKAAPKEEKKHDEKKEAKPEAKKAEPKKKEGK